MIAIIDYGVGNLFSLCSSLKSIGADVVVTSNIDTIRAADKLILPGVGAFADAAKKLHDSGMENAVKVQAAAGKDIMGICLGMQLLFEKSFEYGEHKGLGLLNGSVVPMDGTIPENLKIPHIGWNALHFTKPSKLFKVINENDCVYFVHSYYLQAEEPEIVKATAQYGVTIHASVEKDNIFACQFHPEKSSRYGLKILENFAKLGKEA